MLTQDRVRELLKYVKSTGQFFWRASRSGVAKGPAGSHGDPRGYVSVVIDRQRVWAHRLAFLYVTGSLPPRGVEVDHRNQDKSDNRWCNLRLATKPQNRQNSKGKSSNTSGFVGVHWNKKLQKWQARIRTPEGRKYLGSFPTAAAAGKARQAAAVGLYGDTFGGAAKPRRGALNEKSV